MSSYGALSGSDPELFNSVPDGWDKEIRQLTNGPPGLRVEWADLPGVSIQNFETIGGLLWQERRAEAGAFPFFVVSRAEGTSRAHGVEVGGCDVVLQPEGADLEYLFPPKAHGFAIEVAPSVAERLGWSMRGSQLVVQSTSRRAMRAFVGLCSRTVQAAGSWSGTPGGPRSEILLRDRLLAGIASVLEPRFGRPARRASTDFAREYGLVKRAERWHASRKPDAKLSISEMATALEVPMRTLHRAFDTWTGTSPGRYFTLLRLHDFRKRLAEEGPVAGAVTRAALETGFDHLGRLAGDYRKLFGETPSQSLQRWKMHPRAGCAAGIRDRS